MDNGRSNKVTRLLLHQAIMDIDRNGLAPSKHFSWFKKYSCRAVDAGHFVPVLARSSVSRHSWQQPPMAGRLPLINSHNKAVMKNQRGRTTNASPSDQSQAKQQGNEAVSKRRRVQPQDDGPRSQPQPLTSAAPSMFAHIQILDPWTGPSSSLGHTDFGIESAAFPTMPSLTPVSTSYLDNAILAVQAQAALELPLDPTLLLDAAGGDGTGHGNNAENENDAWTSFLHSGDFDSSGWA